MSTALNFLLQGVGGSRFVDINLKLQNIPKNKTKRKSLVQYLNCFSGCMPCGINLEYYVPKAST